MKLIPSIAALLLASLASGIAGSTNVASVGLQWDPNPESDLAGYRVRWGTAPGIPLIVREAGLSTRFVWTGLLPGVTNYFTVIAYNKAQLESEPSNEVKFSLSEQPTAPVALSGVVVQIVTTVSQNVTNTFRVP